MQLNPFHMPAHFKMICFSALALLSHTSWSMDNLDRRLMVNYGTLDRSKYFSDADHAHAETIGFPAQVVGTPKTYKFYRSNAMTMNITALGAGINLSTNCYLFSENSPSNPAHVAGFRSFYRMSYDYARSPISTASVEISFQTGLPVNGYLLFLDFDANEEISIKAYNSANVLIPYSDMTFTRHNGQTSGGSAITTTVFTDIGSTYTGKVEDEGGTSQNDIVVSLQSSQVIKRVVYEVQMNPTASTTISNTMGFNFVVPTTPGRVYVNHAAGGANNGTSWTDAFTSLQAGIDNSFSGDELWVAKGTYKPSATYELANTTSRYRHFRIPNSVSIYGGFVSGQTDTSQRSNYGIGGSNETILSGDLNGDDNYTVTPWTGVSDNSYHVIYHPAGTCMGLTSRLNGCTIQGGYANSTAADPNPDADGGGMLLTDNTSILFNGVNLINNYALKQGGGIYASGGATTIHFSNLTITKNIASGTANETGGGGMAIYNATASISNGTISNNTATTDGGGLLVSTGATLTITSTTISSNTADDGGGIYLDNAGTTINATGLTLSSNTSADDGGAIFLSDGCSMTATELTVTGNSATGTTGLGGGIIISGSSTLNANDVTVSNNSASGSEGQGGGIYLAGASSNLQLTDFSITGNTASASINNETGGGGLAIYDGTASLNEGTISNNIATIDGGGILVAAGADVTVTNTTISSNTADDGGGIYVLGSGTTFNATLMTVSNNTSADDAGGIFLATSSSMTATNLTVTGNNASGDDGGGILLSGGSTLTGTNVLINNNTTTGDDGGGLTSDASTVTINNGTITGNRCKDDGGGIKLQASGTTTLNNCIIWGNESGKPVPSASPSGKQLDLAAGTLILNYSLVPTTTKSTGTDSEISGAGTLTVGAGNITADPQFRNSVTGDYRLTSGSPAADAGNDTYNSQTTDIRGAGFGRKLLKTNMSTTGTIDIGAYEYNSTTDANKSWTGAVSNLWNVAGNWSDNAVPHANDIIEINSGTAQLNTDFTTDRNVTIGGTGTLTLLPTSSISVGAAGTLNMGGRPVTLKSDATGTARIGQILGTLSGATDVTVERYMPAGRKWRFFCAPLTGSTNNSVFYNWQNNDVPNGNTGVEIWGPAGTADPSSANNGLAVGPHASMRYYDAGWQPVTSTNASLLFNSTTNIGYALFQTGPYNNGSTTYIGGPGNLPNGIATTLSATGSLISGTHTKTLTATTAGQYFLVANPYASPVNPTTFTPTGTINRTNLDNTLYMWDAKPGGTNGLGRYVSFDINAGQYSSIGAGTGFTAHTTQIQSGQAFFVRATAAGAATLVFHETSKGSLVNMDMMGDATPAALPSLRFQLWQDSVNYDGAVAYFHPGASRSLDAMDGTKMLNGTDNLGFRREGKTLVFEHHPELTATDTLFLQLSQMRQVSYRMRMEAAAISLPTGMNARLIDRFTGQETIIDLGKPNDIDFTVGADSASSGGRFMVVFGAKAGVGAQTAEPGNAGTLKVFPNPVAGSSAVSVTLDAAKAPWSLRVLDQLGREVWQQTGVSAPRIEIPVSGFSRGIYHLVATDATGTRTVSDIVRQ